MGWFSRTPSWQKAADKASRALEGGDDSSAYHLLTEALASCPDDEKPRLVAQRDRASDRLFERNLDAAQEHVRQGQLDLGLERYQLALQFARLDKDREKVEGRLKELEEKRLQLEEASQAAQAPGELVDLDEFDLFNSLTATLPEELADQYFEQPEPFRKAVVALHTGRAAEALEHLEQVGRSSDRAVVRYEYGTCLGVLGRTQEAIAALLEAEKLAPEWLAIKLALAQLCWIARRYELAEEVLQRAIDTDDQDLDVYWAICRTALLVGNPDYGLEAADVALEIAPQDNRLLVLKGQLLELAGKTDEALDLYEQVLEATWQYDAMTDSFVFEQDAALLAARIYRRRGQKLDRAEDLYRGLIAVAPARDRWRYELSLADVLLQAGQEEEGRELLTHASRKIPEEDRLGRMRAYELMGEQDKVAALLATLDDEGRSAWEAAHARVEEEEPLPPE
ncbi:MAG: tetratricopeptide repeat protein [Bradymonadales bacterium]|nr:tetratricopeptide repeat protein [Bradymonadales bacterium]